MKPFEILIVLACAGLGFGIVNSLINAARQPGHIEDSEREDPGPPDAF